MKKVLVETALVAIIGVSLAFAANAISNRGLKISRDYFQRAAGLQSPVAAAGTNQSAAPTAGGAAARLIQEGLQVVDEKQVHQLFEDSRATEGAIAFIDARNEEHYQQGHIPGAYQFDRYHPENYLAAVLPICQNAQQVVVYCTGGDCEDSEFAAIFLRDSAGIPGQKLFVYVGGITEWTSRGFPVEEGVRKSGRIRGAKP